MHDPNFQLDRVALFAKTPSKIFIGHIASASVLIYLAWAVLPLHWIVAWGIIEIIITPLILLRWSKKAQHAVKNRIVENQLDKELTFLLCFIGFSWGIFLSASLNPDNPAHFGMQMAIAAGASAASVKSLGIFKNAFYLYEIPFMTLVTTRLFMIGGDQIMLGVLVLVFMVMLCGYARDTYNGLTDYFSIKLENLDLAEKYRIAAENAEEANAAKSLFLTQANHELRQPIHAIGLLSASLRDTKSKAETAEILNTIDSALDSLANLFKSLLGITALERGSVKPEFQKFALDDLLKQTVRQIQFQASEQNCEIRIVSTAKWVQTDRALLASVLQNLLTNAVKYSEGSKILIGARNHGSTVSLHVLDQGPGLEDAVHERIFKEFTRVTSNSTKHIEGMGLGLSIVSKTANLLGLRLGFQSAIGKGTHISVSGIELCKASELVASTGTPIVGSKRSLPVIGLIDDNTHVLQSTETLLNKWGYPIVRIDPTQTDSIAQKIEMLVTDYQIGQSKNGIELAAEISSGDTRDIPTLIISGTITEKIAETAKQRGHWSLDKPVKPAELRSVLLAMSAKLAR